MKSVNAVLKLVIFILIIFGITFPRLVFSNTPDYDYSYPDPDEGSKTETEELGGGDDDEDFVISYKIHERLFDIMSENREALDLLFQSAEKAEDLVIDKVFIHTNYWLLDEALYSIEEQLLKRNNSLDDVTLLKVEEIQSAIRDEQNDLHRHPDYDLTFFEQLNSSIEAIDCAIGRHARNDHLNAVEQAFVAGYWDCVGPIPSLWRAFVEVNYDNKSCTLEQALDKLIRIEQAAKRKQTSDFRIDAKFVQIKLEMLMVLSEENQRNFLMNLICDDQDLCEIYNEALCSPDLYHVVSQMIGILERKTKNQIPSDPESIIALLRVLRGLSQVANQLTTVASVRSSPNVEQDAQNMLVYYLGIINVAFGGNSTNAWKQTTILNALRQFQQILIENDNYVGFAAEMILDETEQSNLINETAVSVYMRRLPSSSDNEQKVEFNFGDVQIWTEDLTNSTLSNSSANAYALYYNSWNDILRNINGSSELSAGSNSTQGNRFFIGKGGVVSFTSKINEIKKSIPVFYRINFDDLNAFQDQDGNPARRCLSCGYFDLASYSWKSEGCHVVSADDVGVTCHCNHTTNFAAFMSPYANEYDLTDAQSLWLNIFEYVGSITSVVGLSLSFITFYIVRNAVRNDRLRAHMNLVAALLFVHLIQIGAEFATSNNNLCIATTLATHYFLLATFMWMLIEGVFLYFYVVQVFARSRTENKKWMYVVGWFVPLVIVVASAGYGIPNDKYVHPQNPVTSQCEDGQLLYPPAEELKYSVCWLNSYSGMTWSFVGPAIVVVLLNMIILCKVVAALAKLSDRNKAIKRFQTDSASNPNKPKTNGTPQLLSYKTTTYEVESDGRVNWLNNNVYDSTKPIPQGQSSHFKYHQDRYPTLTFNSNRSQFVKEAKRTVKGAAVLLPLLGISWIFGTVGYKSYAVSLIFVILNSIQGVAIFLIYCVFNGEVYRALQRRITRFCMGRKQILRRRSISSGSVKSAFNKGVLRNWTRRSTLTPPLNRSNTPV